MIVLTTVTLIIGHVCRPVLCSSSSVFSDNFTTINCESVFQTHILYCLSNCTIAKYIYIFKAISVCYWTPKNQQEILDIPSSCIICLVKCWSKFLVRITLLCRSLAATINFPIVFSLSATYCSFNLDTSFTELTSNWFIGKSMFWRSSTLICLKKNQIFGEF